MTSKVVFLFLVSFTLVLGSFESEYAELMRKEDAKMMRNFHTETDPLKVRQVADLIFAKALALIEKGKQRAVHAAGNNKELFKRIKNEWFVIQDEVVVALAEVQQIVDSLRIEAMLKTPDDWEQVIVISMHYWEALKKATALADPDQTRTVIIEDVNYHRQVYTSLKKKFASIH